jgi:hypothetical protein
MRIETPASFSSTVGKLSYVVAKLSHVANIISYTY